MPREGIINMRGLFKPTDKKKTVEYSSELEKATENYIDCPKCKGQKYTLSKKFKEGDWKEETNVNFKGNKRLESYKKDKSKNFSEYVRTLLEFQAGGRKQCTRCLGAGIIPK